MYRALGDTEDARQAVFRYENLQNYFAERTNLLLRAGENDDPEMPLKLARLAVRHRAYQAALLEYKRAMNQLPGDPGIQREMAAVQAHAIKQ